MNRNNHIGKKRDSNQSNTIINHTGKKRDSNPMNNLLSPFQRKNGIRQRSRSPKQPSSSNGHNNNNNNNNNKTTHQTKKKVHFSTEEPPVWETDAIVGHHKAQIWYNVKELQQMHDAEWRRYLQQQQEEKSGDGEDSAFTKQSPKGGGQPPVSLAVLGFYQRQKQLNQHHNTDALRKWSMKYTRADRQHARQVALRNIQELQEFERQEQLAANNKLHAFINNISQGVGTVTQGVGSFFRGEWLFLDKESLRYFDDVVHQEDDNNDKHK